MNALNLEATQDTPHISLDKGSGKFEVSGRSLPEDVIEFYTPVIEWLQGYAKAPNAKTVFMFKLDYFNTASSKLILELLKTLTGINGAQVEWYYEEGDEDVLDAGKEFSEQVTIPFDFKVLE